MTPVRYILLLALAATAGFLTSRTNYVADARDRAEKILKAVPKSRPPIAAATQRPAPPRPPEITPDTDKDTDLPTSILQRYRHDRNPAHLNLTRKDAEDLATSIAGQFNKPALANSIRHALTESPILAHGILQMSSDYSDFNLERNFDPERYPALYDPTLQPFYNLDDPLARLHFASARLRNSGKATLKNFTDLALATPEPRQRRYHLENIIAKARPENLAVLNFDHQGKAPIAPYLLTLTPTQRQEVAAAILYTHSERLPIQVRDALTPIANNPAAPARNLLAPFLPK